MSWLFNVLDAPESIRSDFFELGHEINQVLHIRTLLIEVERVNPCITSSCRLRFSRDTVDGSYAIDIPLKIIACQFDFQVGKAICIYPLAKGFGDSIV